LILFQSVIGDNERFKFPIRTALSVIKNKEVATKVFPFVQANIVIPYEKGKCQTTTGFDTIKMGFNRR
jgi:hypothetical protein